MATVVCEQGASFYSNGQEAERQLSWMGITFTGISPVTYFLQTSPHVLLYIYNFILCIYKHFLVLVCISFWHDETMPSTKFMFEIFTKQFIIFVLDHIYSYNE